MQRALRERREGADLLDLVAEELDPERLAARRREDVDEPAAHRELAALLDALDALVAGERERLGERLDARLVAARDAERRRARRAAASAPRARPPRSRRARRGEHVEGARPLADEVRRRLQPGLPADAAARRNATRSSPRNHPAASARSRASASSGKHDEPAAELS